MLNLKEELEKLNSMKLPDNHVPSNELLKQSQIVDKLLNEIMLNNLSTLKGGNKNGR